MPRHEELTPKQEKLAAAVTAALIGADSSIRDAIRAAAEAGVSANEIARRAEAKLTGVRGYSRPVVLEILGAEDIRATAIAALEEAGIRVGGTLNDRYDEDLDVAVWEAAVRSVWISLTEELTKRSPVTRGNLAINALRALQGAGLALCQGNNVHDMHIALMEGETVEIYKL